MTDAPHPLEDLRILLFGNRPLAEWPPTDDPDQGEPWDSFVRGRQHLADGDQDLAAREWSAIAMVESFESRHRLQAWHFLRGINIHPDASFAADAWGAVAEVPVDDGHDVLAAYADESVRFLHHLGGGTVIDEPPLEVAQPAAGFLAVAQQAAQVIGVWDQPELPPLPAGHTRFTVCTAAGLRFGQGPDEVFRNDPMANTLFDAATALFVAVVQLATGDPSVGSGQPGEPG